MNDRLGNIEQTPKILGVEYKLLRSHPDNRGFFREIIRKTDAFFPEAGFAQWSHSKMAKNVVKAWHYHHLQTDWWYVGMGTLEVVLYDNREESSTYGNKQVFLLGDAEFHQDCREAVVRIPPGVLHGAKVLSDFAHLFYITSEIYNPDDEGRFIYNQGPVEHDWGDAPIVSERDKVEFVPKHGRRSLC